MNKTNEILSEEELKKSAYLAASRFHKSGMDIETIYARLEKQGFSDELANKVIADIIIEDKKRVVNIATPFYKIAVIRIGIGVLAAIMCAIFLPGITILPIGLIVTGLASAFMFKRNID